MAISSGEHKKTPISQELISIFRRKTIQLAHITALKSQAQLFKLALKDVARVT